MSALFPSGGDSREDQATAQRLAWKLRDAVTTAIRARLEDGIPFRLDVRVSRRAGVGLCIILHRILGERNAHASGDWLPWSWPLLDFTPDDADLLHGGQLPALLVPCVLSWSAKLRRPSPDPRVTL